MTNKKYFKNNFIDIILAILYLIIMTYIYIGFYFPDPFTINKFRTGFITLLLLGIRTVFPLIAFGLLFVYYAVRTKKIPFSNVIISFVSICVSLFLLYYLAVFAYTIRGSYKEIVQDYHPFLQLSPPRVTIGPNVDSNTIRILCVGGSTTEFKGKKKGMPGWPALVEKHLQSDTAYKNIKVYNLGRQWYTTLHTLINYETNLRHHKPEIIIVMHGINDLLVNADKSYFSHKEFQEDYSHFYGAVNRIITNQGLLKRFFEVLKIWYHKPREILEVYDFPGLVPFERNLNTLIDIAKVDSTLVILMTQPNLFKENMSNDEKEALHMVNVESYGPKHRWSFGTALRGMQAYNDMVRNIAKERDAFLIDLEKEVPKSFEYFWDDVHYCDKTFDIISEYIYQELIKQRILEKY